MNAIEQLLKWSRIKLGVLNFSVCRDFDVNILLYAINYTSLPLNKIIFQSSKEIEHFLVKYDVNVALSHNFHEETGNK